jgi:hypothetical protein
MTELITVEKIHYNELVSAAMKVARIQGTLNAYKLILETYKDISSDFMVNERKVLIDKIELLERILND